MMHRQHCKAAWLYACQIEIIMVWDAASRAEVLTYNLNGLYWMSSHYYAQQGLGVLRKRQRKLKMYIFNTKGAKGISKA
jgi:hypothetical protein